MYSVFIRKKGMYTLSVLCFSINCRCVIIIIVNELIRIFVVLITIKIKLLTCLKKDNSLQTYNYFVFIVTAIFI